MIRKIDPRHFNNLIDANVLDRTGMSEDTIVDQILSLEGEGKFILMLPHSVNNENKHPNTPEDIKRLTRGLIYTEPVPLTTSEKVQLEKVQDILRGNAKSGKHNADALHIVESAKYGGYFITNDKRILKKRQALPPTLDVVIVSPKEFLNLYLEFEGTMARNST